MGCKGKMMLTVQVHLQCKFINVINKLFLSPLKLNEGEIDLGGIKLNI